MIYGRTFTCENCDKIMLLTGYREKDHETIAWHFRLFHDNEDREEYAE